MKDHSWLLILGAVIALAPFVLIGIGITSEYRAAHQNRPYETHNARNIVLGFAVAIVATLMFGWLSHHSQPRTLGPVRADSSLREPFVPSPTTLPAAAPRAASAGAVCGNLAEVDYHHVCGPWIWPHSVCQYPRQGHDAHCRSDRSVCHHDRQATDDDCDDQEHSRHDNHDPEFPDDEYNTAAVNDDDDDPTCHNDDGSGDHDNSHDGAGDHDNGHDGAGDHDNRRAVTDDRSPPLSLCWLSS